MIVTTFTFHGIDNKKIFTHQWLPDDTEKIKAVVQIAHGMAEHSARYTRYAEKLVHAGYAVYANDHRGHGKTAGDIDSLGYFADNDGWNLVVSDMHQLTQTIKKNHPGLPVFLFGHSMGSFLSRDYMFTYGEDISGVILSATAGDPGLLGKIGQVVAKTEASLRGKKAKSPMLDKLSFGSFNKAFTPNRTAYDWLSRDDGEVDKYANDPMCGTVFTTGFFRDLLGGLQKINNKTNISNVPKNLPVYLFAGANDPVGERTKGVKKVFKAFKKAGIRDLSIKFYEDGRHEMHNEINRDEVFEDVINWFDSHMPATSKQQK